jgi:aspartyl-tRNA(Asn)/glutamyl-tRNA(Gln) amidotransferase subunit C
MLAFAMPAGLTRDQVLGIAALANLELSATEVELFTRQLADILAYVDQLRQVDTTGIPPTAHAATLQLSDRPDEVKPCLDPAEALAGAPDAADAAFFKVPRVIG